MATALPAKPLAAAVLDQRQAVRLLPDVGPAALHPACPAPRRPPRHLARRRLPRAT